MISAQQYQDVGTVVEVEPTHGHSTSQSLNSEGRLRNSSGWSGDERLLPRARATVLRRVGFLVLGWLLFLLPLLFGGAHPTSYLLSYVVVFGATIVALFIAPEGVGALWKRSANATSTPTPAGDTPGWPVSKFVAITLTTFILLACGEGIIRSVTVVSHPVLGEASALRDGDAFTESLLAVLFFFSTWLFTRFALESSRRAFHWLMSAIVFSGSVVAMIALAHWFSDNGKLFWVFAPENLFVSTRARWPFVNSNHLAAFLLIPFFLSLTTLFNAVREGIATRQSRAPRPLWFERSRRHKTLERTIVVIAWHLFGTVAILLAILASLSRGGWFGLAVGILLFVCGLSTTAHPYESETPLGGDRSTLSDGAGSSLRERSRSRARRNRPHSRSASRLAELSRLRVYLGPLLVVGALVLLGFFLSGRGSELIEERINYGLAYSKDDMRWQMYSDSLPIITSSPLWGVGLGNWAATFPRQMNMDLAGLDPEYLHSDPLQLLIEVGVIGALPILLLVLGVGRAILRSVIMEGDSSVAVLGLSCGLFALVLASAFDFPFRMSAILSLVAVSLALTTFYLDNITRNSGSDPSSE